MFLGVEPEPSFLDKQAQVKEVALTLGITVFAVVDLHFLYLDVCAEVVDFAASSILQVIVSPSQQQFLWG